MEEKIDVLMATYNGEKYVKEQIESILYQSYKNITLIISDDCSTDNTHEILKEYEDDQRVQIFYQEKNLGYVKNFEFLLTKVESNYFVLSDQDDVWLPEKIEKTYKKIKEGNNIFAFGDLKVVDSDLNMLHPSFAKLMNLDKKIKKYKDSYKLNYLYNCVTGCTIMAKKELIEKVLPLPNDSKYLIHDHWIALIASFNGKVSYIEETLIKYRQHDDNQLGTVKPSHKMSNLRDVRELFINVKLGLFGSYVKYNESFPKDVQLINIKALDYYKKVEQKKYFNFECWDVFHKLYKTESFMYYIENFLIFNMPLIANPLFKIRYGILKLLVKR